MGDDRKKIPNTVNTLQMPTQESGLLVMEDNRARLR